MRKTTILILLIGVIQLISINSFCANNALAKSFSIGNKNANSMEIQFRLPHYVIEDIADKGTVYNKIKIDETGYLIETGMPELPFITTTIAVPNHGQVNVEIIDSNQKTIPHIMPYPAQDGKGSDTPKGLTINQAFYNSSETYPQEMIKYSEPQILRDFRIITVQIHPFAWNATTHELIVRDRVNFKLNFNNSPGINEIDGPLVISPSFKKLYEANILNFADYRDGMVANTPPKYLIIYGSNTDPGFLSSLNAFSFWKKQKGAEVRQVSTAVTGTTNTAIKAFIQNIYNDVNARPDFVIFIGDTTGSFPVPSYGTQGDYPYQQLGGNDLLGDVFLGRISAESTSQLDVILSKIYFYERDLNIANAQWLNRMLLVGDTDHNEASVVYTSKYIKELGLLYNPDYAYVELYAAPFASAMNTAINQGVGIFNYRGYLGMSGWSPGSSLINGTKLPHAVLITCGTGSFDGTTDDTENFIRLGTAAVPAGAVTAIGMIGSGTHTMFNNALDIGIFCGIYNHDMRTMGEALLNGKVVLSEIYSQTRPSYVASFSGWCNLMGDPTMEVFCKLPDTFVSDVPATMIMGTPSLEVNVLNQHAEPVADASVTISQGNIIMAKGYTDVNGWIYLDFNAPVGAGTAVVTISKHDYKPLRNIVNIDSNGSLVANASLIDDDNIGSSNGNSNYSANSGETLEILFSVKNTTNQMINNVTGYATCNNPYITVIDSLLNFASIDANSSNYTLLPLVIQIGYDCPNNTPVRFDLHLTDIDDSVYVFPDYLKVTDAFMKFISYQVIDNENNALDPDETADFKITVKNTGTVPIENLYAQLVTQNDLVQVIDNSGYIGSLLVGGQISTETDFYQLHGRTQMLPGMIIPMRLKLYNDNGFLQWIDFSFTPGIVTQADPMGPDEYGYVIYDITDTGYEDCPVYDWIGIAPAEGGSGTLLPITDTGSTSDEGDLIFAPVLAVVDLPFPFTFYGESHNQITVCSNGFLTMGVSENSNYRNFHIPDQGLAAPTIAPFWDDLITTGGGIYTWHDVINHSFIVEWYQCKNGKVQTAEETFQVILYDPAYYPTSLGDGPVKIQYKVFNNVDTGSTTTEYSGNYSTIGIQNSNISTGLEYSFNNQYPTAAAPLSHQTALYITNAPVYYHTPHLLYDSSYILDNNNNVAEPNETVDLYVNLINIGEETAQTINSVLSSNSPYVTLIDNESPYSSIPGDSLGVNQVPFRLSISNDCPDKQIIPFSLNVTTDTNNWVRTFNILVEKSNLIYYSYLVSDTLGNNNSVADPGETLTLIINVRNNSLVNAYDLFATLSTANTDVIINNPLLTKPMVSPDEIMQFAYSVSLSQLIVNNTYIPFEFNLVSATAPPVDQVVTLACGTSGMIIDFESTDGNFITTGDWEFGTPDQTIPHSGSNVWCTGLNGDYANNAMYILRTPPITLGANAVLSFWHLMSCQNYYDGGNLSISTDGGNNFTLIHPAGGYNTSFAIYSLGEIGFTNYVPWSQATFDLSAYANTEVVLRWRFGSNSSFQGDGWFIDDVMISDYYIKVGILSGSVTLTSLSNPSSVKLRAQNKFTTTPDFLGAYAMYLPTGTYEITASLPYHTSQVSPTFEFNNIQQINSYDFTLDYLPNPTGLTVSHISNQSTVTVTWVPPFEPDYPVLGYNLYRRFEDHPYQIISQADTTVFVDVPTSEGWYYYYARAVYHEGEGAPTEVDSVEFSVVSNSDMPIPNLMNALHTNYPNPFNPATTITYSIAKTGKVSLRIYNTKGQLVKTLESGNKKAGQHKIIWNGVNDSGKSVSSGLYFYKLEIPGYSNIRKMLLLK